MPDGPEMSTSAPLAVSLDRDGALLRLRLARPKANLIDAAMIAALHGALRDARGRSSLRGVLLDAEGPHFSFGASVDEHRAENCAAMLSSLHALIVAMLGFQLVVNIGMSLGVMPVAGLTLPLVSYGGSSMLATMFALGLLQSIHVHARESQDR